MLFLSTSQLHYLFLLPSAPGSAIGYFIGFLIPALFTWQCNPTNELGARFLLINTMYSTDMG
jgi:hypothetical protein